MANSTELKHVIKIGNSFAVTISKPFLLSLGLLRNDLVVIRLVRKTLIISKLKEHFNG